MNFSAVPFSATPLSTESLPNQVSARKPVPAMKANITRKLDADGLREARLLAVEEGLSVSALLAAKLDEIVRRRNGCDRAWKRAVARLRKGLDLGWTRPRSRDELHEQ